MNWSVICGDGVAALSGMGDASVDHVISDPPYDEHTQANIRSVWSSGAERVKRTDLSFDHLRSFDFVPELTRIAKRWVLCFCALEQLGDYKQASPDLWIRSGVWHKTMAAPQISGDRPANSCEGVSIFHRAGKKRWNGGGKHAFWKCNPVRSERVHPTQKPLEIMLEIVSMFTDRGDVVLDPFCGSGTTGVACLRLGRKFIGYEVDPAMATIASERLSAEELGMTLAESKSNQSSIFERIAK